MSSRDEHALVVKAVAGDTESLERLLYQHFSPLAGHLGRKIPQWAQSLVSVDDIVQQTFVHVFRDIGRFQPRDDGSLAAWLKSIAMSNQGNNT
jgi:DNA-directed RNA polymerase specialized sigma24 family protein